MLDDRHDQGASISWKWCVMTGKRLAAWTIAYPIRWVNEIFLPLAASCALRAFRRASSVVAEMSRNEVAVGTVSDSVMFATNRAAGPVMGLAPFGRGEMGDVPIASERSPGIIGSSARRPLSNSSRHSWPTDDGSRR